MNNTGTFNESDLLRVMAVVNIFETGQPFGRYSAVAVLDDGAGISYGISQFTHRSGSLAAVVEDYLAAGGRSGRGVLRLALPTLRLNTPAAVRFAASDPVLKNALRLAAATPEMQAAQHRVAFERYLRPAIEACAGSGFVMPLSLAVVYDSMTHGSWPMIRDRVTTPRPSVGSVGFEKGWITAYVKKRHEWLRSVPRLRSTSYRTTFFLMQILAGNWQLRLPVAVHGRTLSEKDIPPVTSGNSASAAGHISTSAVSSENPHDPSADERRRAFPADTRLPKTHSTILELLEDHVGSAASVFDRFEAVIRTVITRSDAAKSLWTTVIGTAWQAGWAVVSFLIGLPRTVWFAAAVIAASLMFFYLYRQLVLGRIREANRFALLTGERATIPLPEKTL